MKVEIEFVEDVLGTQAGNKELATDFQASKHPSGEPQADELKAIENMDETLEKSSTVFPRNDKGEPFIWEYQIKGFFKETCLAMIETDTLTKIELKARRLTLYMYKRTIHKMVRVKPRQMVLKLPDGTQADNLKFLERPLRGQTMRGERISLARSEIIPIGTKFKVEITCRNKELEPYIKRWLDDGIDNGMLQFRTGGYGRFKWRELK